MPASLFSKLETTLQSLVEESAARLFPARISPEQVLRQLMAAMQTGRKLIDGQWTVPEHYQVYIHPTAARLLRDRSKLISWLSQQLSTAAVGQSLVFSAPVDLQLVEDASLPRQVIQVQASFMHSLPHTTSNIEVKGSPDPIPTGAYLVVNGIDTFPIEFPVINIGRRTDNHLVIDDPRISRLHAQLRAINGHLTLFDLDSVGGTFVNGTRIQEWALSAGDVISLAGVPLVYNQDKPAVSDTQKMEILPPPL